MAKVQRILMLLLMTYGLDVILSIGVSSNVERVVESYYLCCYEYLQLC